MKRPLIIKISEEQAQRLNIRTADEARARLRAAAGRSSNRPAPGDLARLNALTQRVAQLERQVAAAAKYSPEALRRDAIRAAIEVSRAKVFTMQGRDYR